MKKIYYIALALISGNISAQTTGKVGINTDAPAATLDIRPTTANAAESATTNEGILIPRLSKARVLAIALTNRVEGTLVYVTDAVAATDNANFTGTGKGFYYWDSTASKWTKINQPAENLYTVDGTLTGDRKVNLLTSNLEFSSNNDITKIFDESEDGIGVGIIPQGKTFAVGINNSETSDNVIHYIVPGGIFSSVTSNVSNQRTVYGQYPGYLNLQSLSTDPTSLKEARITLTSLNGSNDTGNVSIIGNFITASGARIKNLKFVSKTYSVEFRDHVILGNMLADNNEIILPPLNSPGVPMMGREVIVGNSGTRLFRL